MESKDFKKMFGKIAKCHGFDSAYGGWFKHSNESLLILELQRSNFSDIFYLNIKIFIQGVFGKNYSISKDLVKNSMGQILRRPHPEYAILFNLQADLDDDQRKTRISDFFQTFLKPFAKLALTREGVKHLAQDGQFTLYPPAIAEEIDRLSQ